MPIIKCKNIITKVINGEYKKVPCDKEYNTEEEYQCPECGYDNQQQLDTMDEDE